MRGKITLMLLVLISGSCGRSGIDPDEVPDNQYGRDLTHEQIVLGSRLENPYKTENVARALSSLYPTKADRVQVETTDLYVRFLPENEEQLEILQKKGVCLTDHPLDYEILVDGDWYHDPEVPDDMMTWQYAVVPEDFVFPDMEYELIDECHISENASCTRADEGIDWDAVEREAYVLTGNARFLAPQTKADKVRPAGRITVIDEDAFDGKPVGVKGVRVSCNSFVKFAHAYTDEDGYYEMDRSFSAELRYRLVFDNVKDFSIGFNLILEPASASTLGKTSPEGVDMTVTKDSESKLFKRCAANNAVYDYYERCSPEDLDLPLPPKDLRIWLFHKMKASCAPMLHHGALLDLSLVSAFLGDFAPLVKVFLPDLVIGVERKDDFSSIYAEVCHELAHASHFTKAGTDFWNKDILYILESFLESGVMDYGDGTGKNAGYCEVSEMWAYHLSSKMWQERYGGDYPAFGTSFWFYPQILRYIEQKCLECREILSVMDSKVTSRDALQRALTAYSPDHADYIELIFNRYMQP